MRGPDESGISKNRDQITDVYGSGSTNYHTRYFKMWQVRKVLDAYQLEVDSTLKPNELHEALLHVKERSSNRPGTGRPFYRNGRIMLDTEKKQISVQVPPLKTAESKSVAVDIAIDKLSFNGYVYYGAGSDLLRNVTCTFWGYPAAAH